ncbi:Copia protein [Dufourea novaeangliae]|uniref:Copia protein n=1 Tax=Dufourea novaeangliae TaxID=178035 RepID=A0A154PT58_DUFNO|nr:Copia protein [Dufourea novaeangliae]
MDYTTPYTPQLNGKAERLNRTLLEKVRALLFDSNVDKGMWGEALYTATYLLNRSPTSVLEVTPAEKWFDKKPDVSRIQLFGSKAYAERLMSTRKLDDRSREYVCVGYGSNCYRLWDKKGREIVYSRDVIFGNTESCDGNKQEAMRLEFSEDGEEEVMQTEATDDTLGGDEDQSGEGIADAEEIERE